MNWKPEYVDTKEYPYVKDDVAIFRWFESCKYHIKKHMLNKKEPWDLIFTRDLYLQTQIKNADINEIYEKLSPELKKAILAMFTYKLYGYLHQHNSGATLYGIDPRGFIIILSRVSLLTAYYPAKAKNNSNFFIFHNNKAILESKIATKQREEAKKTSKDIVRIKSKLSLLYDMSAFDIFFKQYLNIDGNQDKKSIVAQLEELKTIGTKK